MLASLNALFLLLAQGTAVPVPSAADLAFAEKELHRMWRSDYALGPSHREAVAKKFLARGQDVVELPFKYVILRDARELAAQAGDAPTALAAIDAMSATFATDGMTDKTAVLGRIEGQAKTPEDVRAATDLALELVDEAITLARLDTAAAVLTRVAGRASRNDAQMESCRELARRLTRALEIRSAMEAAKTAGLKDWASPWMYVNPADLSRGTFNRRDNAWTSSPRTPSQPFAWVRTVQLTKAHHILYLDVSAAMEPARGVPVAGSWTLRVSANGEELTKKLISGTRWQALEFDLGAYSNRAVSLEVANAPGDGSMTSRACWSNLCILPPPLFEVIPAESDPRRSPLPDAVQQARAERLVQENPHLVSKPGSTPMEKLDLARKLMEQAESSTGDLPYQYLLLKKACDLGLQTGDLKTLSQAIDLMSKSFRLDPFEEKLALFLKVETSRKTPEGLDWHLRVAADAVAAGKAEPALHAISRAERGARAIRYGAASGDIKELSARALEALSKGWASQWIWQDTAPGQILQDTFNRRANAWQTQPAASDRPFRWKRRARLPASQACSLQLEVSGRQPDDHHSWEWNLQVLINGKESLNKIIRGTEWRHFSVDLSAFGGKEVDLELWNKSDDGHGHGQVGYWDRVCLAYEP